MHAGLERDPTFTVAADGLVEERAAPGRVGAHVDRAEMKRRRQLDELVDAQRAVTDADASAVVEIAAALKAARQSSDGRVIAIHQPHRYTRLHDLFDEFCSCFNDADVVAITDVYAAGEEHIEGADGNALVEGLINHGHRNAIALEGETDLSGFVREHAKPGDLVICLGAGSISNWVNDLPAALG